MRIIIWCFILLIFLGCSKLTYQEIIKSEDVTRPILIRNVNIFDGSSEILLRKKDVLISNQLIREIADYIPLDSNYYIIDGSDKTLMPGLIDAHTHLSGSGAVPWANKPANEAYNLTAYLYAGITTVYDLGGISKDIRGLANKVELGEIPGPTIYHTHIPITVKNSHPIPLAKQMVPWPINSLLNSLSPMIDDVSEAEKLIKKYVNKDVDYVKIACDQIPPGSPEMSFEQLKALIDESHRLNKKVFVHVGSPENALNAVQAGADVLAHGIWRGRLTAEQADEIASFNVPVIYTIAGFQHVAEIHQGTFHPDEMDNYLVHPEILNPVTGKNGLSVQDQEVMNAFFEDVAKHQSYWLSNFKLLYEREVPILVGTDSNLPGTYAGSSYFQEFNLLKAYGMSNFEILRAATSLNAQAFLSNPNFGEVQEGYKADLLLIDGNPLEDIEKVKSPELIIVRGDLVSRN